MTSIGSSESIESSVSEPRRQVENAFVRSAVQVRVGLRSGRLERWKV